MNTTRILFSLGLLAAALSSASAQTPLIQDDFDAPAFPSPGWATFVVGAPPPSAWGIWFDEPRNNNLAYAPARSALTGPFVEDYLATPLFTPTADAHTLSFDVGQYLGSYNDAEFSVLVSTGSQTDPADYTVIASYTENEVGVAWAYMYRFTLDLSAYVGTPIHVAFRNRQVNDDDGFFLDNVWIGPEVTAHVARVGLSKQYLGDVLPGTTDAPVIAANVFVDGNVGSVTLDELVFTTEGSTAPASDATESKAAFSGLYMLSELNPGETFGRSYLNPEGDLSFSGSVTLHPGNNYVGLTYSVAADATGGHLLDATVESVTVDGVTFSAEPSSEAGALRIPLAVVNDDLADAVVLAETDTFVGSNVGATSEANETVASCSQDGGNSVYWAYTPTADGTLDVSLAGTDFTAIFSILTGDGHPLTEQLCEAGPGDIVLNNLPVEAGTTYYLRVVGQYGFFGVDEGEIHLAVDFSGAPTNTEDEQPTSATIGGFQPNPAARMARLQIEVAQTQHVTVVLYDLLGQRLATLFDGTLTTRTEEQLTLEVADLPAGTYLCRIQGETFSATRRVTLTR